MGKKRRCEVDLDAERTLYTSFVQAANSISQLYTSAVQQQRRASAAASRQTLERVLGFLLREYGSTDAVPKAALMQFLQQEYENVEGSEHLPHHFPVQLLPVVSQGTGHMASVGSEDTTGSEGAPPSLPKPQVQPTRQPSMAMASPASRRGVGGGLGAYGLAAMEQEHSMDTGSQGAPQGLPGMPFCHMPGMPDPKGAFGQHGGFGGGHC